MFAPDSETSLLALINDSNVPASVHHPSRISHVSSPLSMQALFTSVLSSSPLAEGSSGKMRSHPVLSYIYMPFTA